ncbi:MAG: hypothetical protein ACTSXP_02685 [Promethearchaeota archaeon]
MCEDTDHDESIRYKGSFVVDARSVEAFTHLVVVGLVTIRVWAFCLSVVRFMIIHCLWGPSRVR